MLIFYHLSLIPGIIPFVLFTMQFRHFTQNTHSLKIYPKVTWLRKEAHYMQKRIISVILSGLNVIAAELEASDNRDFLEKINTMIPDALFLPQFRVLNMFSFFIS